MINVLLLTGQDCHDWRRSSEFIKRTLEDTGKYTVTVSEDPNQDLANLDDMKQYDMFFMNWSLNGQLEKPYEWNAQAKHNFTSSVKAGTGLFVQHFSSAAFPEWKEYEQMLGLIHHNPPSAHGDFHEFDVTIVKNDHPITTGLDNFKIHDELFHNLVRIESVPITVLATAFSSADKGGTGNEEPVLAVNNYGEGRVCYSVLGHLWPVGKFENYPGETMVALKNSTFKKIVIRGCAWAAGGDAKAGETDV